MFMKSSNIIFSIIGRNSVVGSSSVSIASDYTLDDRGSIPDRDKHFVSILCVYTSSEVHPASYTVGARSVLSPG
jgi:hypothetical protein